MGQETSNIDSEPQNHQEFLARIQEINHNISRIYDEMEANEKTIIKIEQTKIDQIKRLEIYYRELHKMGAFVEPRTLRQRSLNEMNNVILLEMEKRSFTGVTRRWVNHVLPDDCKRGWRRPIVTEDGKEKNFSLPDPEIQTIYDEYMDYINELANFDYNEIPRALQLIIAEHFYKLYRYHDKQWTNQGITIIKHQDGLNIPNPFAGIVRVEEGIPYEGELFDRLKDLRKAVSDMMRKVKYDVQDNTGRRVITLEQEHEFAMGVSCLIGYFKPWGNYKWKKDPKGWGELILKRLILKSKSGASKFSRKPVDQRFLDDIDRRFLDGIVLGKEDPERGITREEINKIQKRIIKFFLQFIEHHPGLCAMSNAFENITEEKRAAHSIKMAAKLSDSA